MKIKTWEMSNLDWSEQGDQGVALSPDAVADLIYADNIEQARIAFFDVSEAIGANGWIYPCALPVVKTVLAALPGCVGAARDKCLELLAQIAGSQSSPNSPNIRNNCLHELRLSTWYFIYGLQFDDVEFACHYVDILGVLGTEFIDFRMGAKKYLELSLTRNLQEYDIEMVKNTIAELG
jgi:hypothetical protein